VITTDTVLAMSPIPRNDHAERNVPHRD